MKQVNGLPGAGQTSYIDATSQSLSLTFQYVEKWVVDYRFPRDSDTTFRTVVSKDLCRVTAMLSQGTNKEGLIESRHRDELTFVKIMVQPVVVEDAKSGQLPPEFGSEPIPKACAAETVTTGRTG